MTRRFGEGLLKTICTGWQYKGVPLNSYCYEKWRKKLEKKKKIISVFFFLFSGKGAFKTVFRIFQTQLLEERGAKTVVGAIIFPNIIEGEGVGFCGGRTTFSVTVNILFPWKMLVTKIFTIY